MDVPAPHPDESPNRSPDRFIGISIRHQMLILFAIALGIVFCWFLRFSARLTDDHTGEPPASHCRNDGRGD